MSIHLDAWRHGYDETVIYAACNGEESQTLTNHLSSIRFEVTRGSGFIATRETFSQLTEGSIVEIGPKTLYKYGGGMDMVMTLRPGLFAGFVTFDGNDLARPERRLLKKIQGRDFKSQLYGSFYEIADKIMPSIDEMIYLSRLTEGLQDIEDVPTESTVL